MDVHEREDLEGRMGSMERNFDVLKTKFSDMSENFKHLEKKFEEMSVGLVRLAKWTIGVCLAVALPVAGAIVVLFSDVERVKDTRFTKEDGVNLEMRAMKADTETREMLMQVTANLAKTQQITSSGVSNLQHQFEDLESRLDRLIQRLESRESGGR